MLNLEWQTDLVWNFVSSIVLGLFAIAVGALLKFRGVGGWFALYGGAFGVGTAATNLASAHQPIPPQAGYDGWLFLFYGLAASGWILVLVGLVHLVSAYRPGTWRHHWLPWTYGLAGVAALGNVVYAFWGDLVALAPLERVFAMMHTLPVYVVPLMMAAGSMLLAEAYVQRPDRSVAFLGLALAVYPAGYLPETLTAAIPMGWFEGSVLTPFQMVGEVLWWMVFPLAPVVWWLWAARRTGSRTASAVGVVIMAFGATGVLTATFTDYSVAAVARFFDVLLVSYAIFRYQYLGLDLKVRWTLSKTTIGAAFVAVFFIVSEGLSQAFSDFTGSTYVGIGAAGALVFLLAPLQRLGDRLALRAVPEDVPDRAEAYGHAVQAALRDDGKIGLDEEQHLAILAQALGLGPADALAVRRSFDR